jgi:hypothetical protein
MLFRNCVECLESGVGFALRLGICRAHLYGRPIIDGHGVFCALPTFTVTRIPHISTWIFLTVIATVLVGNGHDKEMCGMASAANQIMTTQTHLRFLAWFWSCTSILHDTFTS